MKMRNEEMLQNILLLQSLSEKGRLGYAIARNIRLLRECCTEYINIKNAAILRYGDKSVPPESMEEFVNEVAEFAWIEHEVDVYKVTEDVFTSGNLTSAQMADLMWMIEMSED